MPKLSELNKIKKITLPESGVTLSIKALPSYNDAKAILKQTDNDDQGTFLLINQVFQKWDLLDNDGGVLAFNEDTFGALPMKDVSYALTKVIESIRLTEEEEKK